MVGLQIVTVRNSSWGKVMFSQACVKNSVHKWGASVAGGCAWSMHGRGYAWWGHVWQWGGGSGGMHGRGGGRALPERLPLQQALRILECILVLACLCFYFRTISALMDSRSIFSNMQNDLHGFLM